MNEKAFITKIHQILSPGVYRWKITDPFHGGIPDVYYSGPAGFCFIEYKYKPQLPARNSSKINFGLSEQQKIWLLQQQKFNIPVFVAAGYKNKLILTDNFESINSYIKQEFIDTAITIVDFIKVLETHCLGDTYALQPQIPKTSKKPKSVRSNPAL